MRKVTLIGGGGIRTPLVIHGLAQAQQQLDLAAVALYDIDRERLATVTQLAREAARQLGSRLNISRKLEGIGPAGVAGLSAGEWQPACKLLDALCQHNGEHRGYLL